MAMAHMHYYPGRVGAGGLSVCPCPYVYMCVCTKTGPFGVGTYHTILLNGCVERFLLL